MRYRLTDLRRPASSNRSSAETTPASRRLSPKRSGHEHFQSLFGQTFRRRTGRHRARRGVDILDSGIETSPAAGGAPAISSPVTDFKILLPSFAAAQSVLCARRSRRRSTKPTSTLHRRAAGVFLAWTQFIVHALQEDDDFAQHTLRHHHVRVGCAANLGAIRRRQRGSAKSSTSARTAGPDSDKRKRPRQPWPILMIVRG